MLILQTISLFLFLVNLTFGYNICPPIELRSSITPKPNKSSYLGTNKPASTSFSSPFLPTYSSSPSSPLTTTTTIDGSNGSTNEPNIVCDCTTETRESAPSWEILCYQEYSMNEPDYRSESTIDPETVQYSALPIAFTIKYVYSRYIEINCYDSSPEFQPAMFQGFGVNEIDSFRVINCSLPTVPFNLIFHRTSIQTNKDASSPIAKHQPNRATSISSSNDSGGPSSKVKGIRSLELRRVTPVKVDIKQLKHLFHGLDRLEQLTLENYIIQIGSNSDRNGRRNKRDLTTNKPDNNDEALSKYAENRRRMALVNSPTTLSFEPEIMGRATTTILTTTTAPIELPKSSDKYYTPKGVNEKNSNVYFTVNSNNNTKAHSDLAKNADNSNISLSMSLPSSNRADSITGLNLNENTEKGEDKSNDDLVKAKSTVSGITINRAESQSSSYALTTGSLDFSFGSYFPNLKSLVLYNFLVTKSSDNAFILKSLLSNLNNLEQLDLRSNILTHIPENLFSGSGRKLKRLYLMRNSIESLHPYAFANLKEVEVLDLFSNKIQLLPDSLLRDTANLKQFRLKGNNFITLPLNLFSATSQLAALDLSSNRELSLLPVDLLKGLNNLRNITINDCNLNRFTANPAKFFSYAPNLEKIELKGNLLTNLTQNHLFTSNIKLAVLDVSNNRIREIDANIFNENSSNLIHLNLYNNDLHYIPDKLLYHLKNLRVLNIGNNNLQTINNNIFYTLSNLEILDLSRNQLISVNPGESKIPFGLGLYLKKINLSHNNLTNFNREFNSIQWNLHLEIEEINLSQNKLTGPVQIPIFYSTKSKIILDLRDNQIETINMDAILINEKLFIEILGTNKGYADVTDSSEVKVFISGNPFNCDCNLFPLLKYTRSNTLAKYESLVEKVSFDISSDDLKCASPSDLTGKSFYEISTIDLTCPLYGSKVCPSTCDCEFRAHDERVLVDCSDKNLTSIPREVVSIKNFQNLNLPGNKTVHKVKAATLRMQNNKIKDLQPLEQLVVPSESKTKSPSSVNIISFEIYLDNNTIDSISSSLVDLLRLGSEPSAIKQENVQEQGDSSPSSSPTSHLGEIAKASSPPLSPSSLSSLKTAIISLISLRHNNIHSIPMEFLDSLRDLQSVVSNGSNPTSQALKLYLGNNPYNCTPEGIAGPGEKLFCQMREFKSWLTGNYRIIGDIADIYCDTVNYNSTSALINIPDSVLCPQMGAEDQTLLLTMTAICVVLALCLLLVSILYYRNKQTVLAFFYIHLNPIFVCLHFHEDDIDEDKIYDAFVSYSSADRDIIMQLIEKLEEPSSISNTSICYLQSQSGLPSIHEGNYDQIVPEVNPDIKIVGDKSRVARYGSTFEIGGGVGGGIGMAVGGDSSTHRSDSRLGSGGGVTGSGRGGSTATSGEGNSGNEPDQTQYFKLCIHERDWLPGNLISWNIVNSVQNSRRTIIILSKDFIQSIWFQVEFHTAYYQMLEDKIDRLIVIVRGELPPKEQMDKDLVFLLTTKTYLVWGEKWFWEKLRYALPHKSARKRAALAKSRCLKKSHFSTNAINYLKSGKDGTSKTKSPSKSEMMKEYVDQAIANHFQLNCTNSEAIKSSLNNGSSGKTSSSQQQSGNLSPSNPETRDSDGSTRNKSTIIITANDDREDTNESLFSKQGHVNESFVIETET